MVFVVVRQPIAPEVIDQDVVGLAFRLAGRVRQEFHTQMAAERWAAEAQLRPGCFGVLRVVDAADVALSQRDVSERTGIDASDVVDLVDRLERAGFVRRRRHDRDRRRNVLEVTAAGQRAIERFEAVSRRVDEVILQPLTMAQRTELRRLLGRVVDHWNSPG
ncbi:hypothetical protein BH18ACT2_BH18ACT2_21690 [soil metagenome]